MFEFCRLRISNFNQLLICTFFDKYIFSLLNFSTNVQICQLQKISMFIFVNKCILLLTNLSTSIFTFQKCINLSNFKLKIQEKYKSIHSLTHFSRYFSSVHSIKISKKKFSKIIFSMNT